MSGQVTEIPDMSGSGAPLEGASVSLRVDRGRDGTVDVTRTVTTDADGRFTVSAPVSDGDVVVVAVASEGLAPNFRTIIAKPGAETRVNVALRPLQPLTCDQGTCATQTRGLTLTGMPGGMNGSARLFNPVRETNAFPGGFNDSAGNLLLSGVFSAIQLQDSNGDPVTQLDAPAELCMDLPRDTWPLVTDIQAGNGVIDVPLYAFDEVKGTWIREGQAVLQNHEGGRLSEEDAALVRGGTYAGNVKACGPVSHFSYWNVDWPIASHGCVTGTVTDGSAPVAGAVVTAIGETYTGVSEDQTTGADGRFCVPVMRSEAVGEDVDLDGITGETQRIRLRIRKGTKVYEGGSHDLPTAQATCGGACQDLGSLPLTADRELAVSKCTVSGRVVTSAGAPAANVGVYAFDDTVDGEVYAALCSDGSCSTYETTDAQGAFALTVPTLEGLSLFSFASNEDTAGFTRLRYSSVFVAECPSAPIELRLDEGYTTVEFTVTATGNAISWSPVGRGTYLSVSDAGGAPKWWIYMPNEGTSFSAPITYGVIPSGAQQLFPADNMAPVPLTTGDRIDVGLQGLDDEGFFLWGSGSVTY